MLPLLHGRKDVNKESYLLDWKITEKKYGTLGYGNGVFILRYANKDMIDTLHFQIQRLTDQSIIDIGRFKVEGVN